MKQPIWDTYPHVHLVELLLCFWHSVQKLHCRVVGIVCHIPHPRELIVLGSIEHVSMLLKGALCCCRNVMFIQLHSRQVSAWLHSLHKNVSFYSFFNRRTSFFAQDVESIIFMSHMARICYTVSFHACDVQERLPLPLTPCRSSAKWQPESNLDIMSHAISND